MAFAALSADALGAQGPLRVRDAVSVQRFERHDGLRSSVVYDITVDRDGLLWAATDEGAAYFTGHEWRQVAMPRRARSNQVRAVLARRDGTLWFATRAGIVRFSGNDTTIYDARNGGLADDAVYGLIETSSFGAPTILAATQRGIARFENGRFIAVELPIVLGANGTTLQETVASDGSRELWVAAPNDGLLRMRNGQWDRFGPDQGLFSFSLDDIMAPPQLRVGDPRLYATGPDGIFALVGERWSRVPLANARVVRLAHVTSAAGLAEIWAGTADGRVIRRRSNGQWEDMTAVSGRQAGAVSSLDVVTRGVGEVSVYAGLRGERLIRIMLTPDRSVRLPAAVTDRGVQLVRTVQVGRQEEIWAATSASGVVRVGSDSTWIDDGGGTPVGTVFSLARVGDTVWVASRRGVFARTAAGWRPAGRGLGGVSIRRLIAVPGPDRRDALHATTSDGLWRWDLGQWKRVAVAGISDLTEIAVNSDTTSPAELFVASEGGQVWRITDGVAAPSVARAALSTMESVTDLVVQSHGGRKRLWAATAGTGGIRYLDIDDSTAVWQPLNAEARDALPSDFVRDLAAGTDGRVYAATSGGVAQFLVVTRDSVALETVYGEDDGLASTDVMSIDFDDRAGLIVGTRAGIARIQPAVLIRPNGSPLRLTVSAGAGIPPFDADNWLRHDRASLNFDFALLNYHREEDTRYRTELVGSLQERSGWSATHRTSLSALAPGRYVFRVWARDYRGQITGPREFTFGVHRPPWATPTAIVSYIVLGVVLLGLLIRWQTGAARSRAARLAVSERAARASERKFRALFDRAFDAHLLVDDGRITAANAAAVHLFGATATLERRPIEQLVPGIADLTDPRSEAPSGAPFETTVKRDDGSSVSVEVARTLVPLDQRHRLVHVVLRDVSQEKAADSARRHLEHQMREAQKLESLGTLAGGIAHDFNNLLTVIRGTAELALETEGINAPGRTAFGTILDAGDRARDLVRQILAFSRRSTRIDQPVDLGRMIRELEPLIRSSVPSSIDVELHTAGIPVMVQGDATQLQQVMLNLCTNAEYAMRGGSGTLRVELGIEPGDASSAGESVARKQPHARLKVQDTGRGIAPADLERIFEPFYTTKPVGEGTGLGLAVLHGVVASHHGEVVVRSEVGRGTTFEVIFPLVESNATAFRPVERRPAPIPVNGGRLLLIDDDLEVMDVTRRLLVRLGYQVTGFTSPDQAIGWLRQHASAVDAVLTDQTMPEITGDRVVLEVRLIRDDLPVIILTGFSHLLTPERLDALGAADVLYKPVDREDLVASIESVLASAGAARAAAREARRGP